MTTEEACRRILGVKRANEVIASKGLHWAVVEVTHVATMSDDKEAVAVVRNWLIKQRNA